MSNQTERTPEDSERMLRHVARLAGLGHCVFDLVAHQYESVSEEYARVFGYTIEEFMARFRTLEEDMELVHPEDRAMAVQAYSTSGEISDIEYRILRKDGKVRIVHQVGEYICDEAGAPVRELITLQDITELRGGQAALRESEERKRLEEDLQTTCEYLDSILLNMTAGVAILEGPELRFFRINNTLAHINGLPVEDHLGRPLAEVLRHAAPDIMPRILKVLKTGEIPPPREFSTKLPKDPNQFRWLVESLFPIFGENGEPMAVGAVVLDITERKRLEEEILDISERERRRVGQNLHDDLGQHLTGIGFMAEELEQKLGEIGLPDEAGKVGLMASLVEDAKAKTRSLARGLYPLELNSDGLLLALKNLASQTEEVYGISCMASGDLALSVDESRIGPPLYRIAQEAVTNAAGHGQPSRIDIGLNEEKGQVVMTVEDDGSGLPEDYEQSDGMGLRIMHYRARSIEGTLEVRNVPGGGTIVKCMV